MTRMKEFLVLFAVLILLLFSIPFLNDRISTVLSTSISAEASSYTVVIDAGHGGFDSGKVGIDGTLEKDVNLQIAQKLEKLLRAADVTVQMTRTADTALCEESASSKKRQDMTNRADLMNRSAADCIISIHQNSYPQEAIDGAQVFYYAGSAKGEALAARIQASLVSRADPSNHRVEKPNDTYYLLKQSQAPIVIVECGFLSNWAESKKLVDDAYQQTLAWAIHLGILQYLNSTAAN